MNRMVPVVVVILLAYLCVIGTVLAALAAVEYRDREDAKEAVREAF